MSHDSGCKRILVTGASSGVGRSLVDHLKGRFEVIAVARREERMREHFGRDPSVHCYGLDLADRAGLADLAGILERHGPVLNVINNAGVGGNVPVEDLTLERLDRYLAVNVHAPLSIMQMVLGSMVEHGFGRIINVTSGAPLNCFPGYAAYSSSKAALNAITVTAAREYAQHDIKINLMSPGPVRSEMAPSAPMDPSVCHPTVDHLLGLGAGGPTGRFFWLGYEIPLFPVLHGIDWLGGTAGDQYTRVL